jgi:hypothetical protein
MGTIEIGSIIVFGLVILIASLTCLFIRLWTKRNPDSITKGFTTSHLIHVKLSKHTKFLTKEKIERWIETVIKFWEDKKGWDPYLIKEAIKNSVVILTDREVLQNGKQWTPALCYPLSKIIEIATLGVGENPIKIERWTRHLFIHELSHLIVIYVGGMVDVEEQHQLFGELNLRSL